MGSRASKPEAGSSSADPTALTPSIVPFAVSTRSLCGGAVPDSIAAHYSVRTTSAPLSGDMYWCCSVDRLFATNEWIPAVLRQITISYLFETPGGGPCDVLIRIPAAAASNPVSPASAAVSSVASSPRESTATPSSPRAAAAAGVAFTIRALALDTATEVITRCVALLTSHTARTTGSAVAASLDSKSDEPAPPLFALRDTVTGDVLAGSGSLIGFVCVRDSLERGAASELTLVRLAIPQPHKSVARAEPASAEDINVERRRLLSLVAPELMADALIPPIPLAPPSAAAPYDADALPASFYLHLRSVLIPPSIGRRLNTRIRALCVHACFRSLRDGQLVSPPGNDIIPPSNDPSPFWFVSPVHRGDPLPGLIDLDHTIPIVLPPHARAMLNGELRIDGGVYRRSHGIALCLMLLVDTSLPPANGASGESPRQMIAHIDIPLRSENFPGLIAAPTTATTSAATTGVAAAAAASDDDLFTAIDRALFDVFASDDRVIREVWKYAATSVVSRRMWCRTAIRMPSDQAMRKRTDSRLPFGFSDETCVRKNSPLIEFNCSASPSVALRTLGRMSFSFKPSAVAAVAGTPNFPAAAGVAASGDAKKSPPASTVGPSVSASASAAKSVASALRPKPAVAREPAKLLSQSATRQLCRDLNVSLLRLHSVGLTDSERLTIRSLRSTLMRIDARRVNCLLVPPPVLPPLAPPAAAASAASAAAGDSKSSAAAATSASSIAKSKSVSFAEMNIDITFQSWFLPAVVYATDWDDAADVSELHRLLDVWPRPHSSPMLYLPLLSPRVTDRVVRAYAVRGIDAATADADDRLALLLPQLVQCVKGEPQPASGAASAGVEMSASSPLVAFLLRRARASLSMIAFPLLWLVHTELCAAFYPRRMAGLFLSLTEQLPPSTVRSFEEQFVFTSLLGRLHREVAERGASASKTLTRSVFAAALNRLSDWVNARHESGIALYAPHRPSVRLGRLVIERCWYDQWRDEEYLLCFEEWNSAGSGGELLHFLVRANDRRFRQAPALGAMELQLINWFQRWCGESGAINDCATPCAWQTRFWDGGSMEIADFRLHSETVSSILARIGHTPFSSPGEWKQLRRIMREKLKPELYPPQYPIEAPPPARAAAPPAPTRVIPLDAYDSKTTPPPIGGDASDVKRAGQPDTIVYAGTGPLVAATNDLNLTLASAPEAVPSTDPSRAGRLRGVAQPVPPKSGYLSLAGKTNRLLRSALFYAMCNSVFGMSRHDAITLLDSMTGSIFGARYGSVAGFGTKRFWGTEPAPFRMTRLSAVVLTLGLETPLPAELAADEHAPPLPTTADGSTNPAAVDWRKIALHNFNNTGWYRSVLDSCLRMFHVIRAHAFEMQAIIHETRWADIPGLTSMSADPSKFLNERLMLSFDSADSVRGLFTQWLHRYFERTTMV